MTSQGSKGSPYKTFVKKLDNGFGIKTVNTLTGVENIIVITADSIKESHYDKKMVNSQYQILRPVLSRFSDETVRATLSIPSINMPNNGINKVLEHLEPYLREQNPDIAGFHIFKEVDTRSSPNKQKTSVIFVANTELARKKSVHFNIPGKLMNTFLVKGQCKEGRIMFEADSIVKPLTIVVSEYVLHINICYDLPRNKTVGTQTKKRYILSSAVDDIDDKPIFKIESFLLSDLQIKHEQKFTQTESSVFVEESQSPHTNLEQLCQDSGTETVFFKDQICTKLMSSSDEKCYYHQDKSDLNLDVGNIKTESFEYSLEKLPDFKNTLNSVTSYDSHTHLLQKIVLNNVNNGKVQTMTGVVNKEVKEKKKGLTTDRKKEKKTLTLFDNSSNYNTKITNSDNVFKNVQPKCSSGSTASTSSKSASFEKDQSETSVRTATSDNGFTQIRNYESSLNVSIKDVKERLNKTTLSLQHLYSVIDMMEEKDDNKHRSETKLKREGYTEREQLNNKTHTLSQPSIMNSQATLDESTSINGSDQSAYFLEMRLRRYESSSITSYDKSVRNYTYTSSEDYILCERCGSFHTYVGFDGDCKVFEKNNIKISEKRSSQGTMNSSSSTDQGNFSNSVSSVSLVANILSGETDSCESRELFNNEMQKSLSTIDKNSTTLCKKHNKTHFHDTAKDVLDNRCLSMTTDTQKSVFHSEESNQMLVDPNYTQTFNENKNQNRSDIEKSSEDTLVSRKECKVDEISTFNQGLADFDKPLQVNNPSSVTIKGSKETSSETISSNEKYVPENCTESKAKCNSTQNVTGLHDTLQEINKDTSYSNNTFSNNIKMDDTKEIEEYDAAETLKGSYTTILGNEKKTDIRKSSILLFFTELKDTKSWISFKKSVKSCHCNEKFGLSVRNTNSAPTTSRVKIKTLSSGDHERENELCKVSSSLDERVNTIGVFNNKSNFLNSKSSSLCTLHIVPSSQELLKLKSQEKSFQDREFSKITLDKIESKSSFFETSFVKLKGNYNKTQDESLLCTTKYSRYLTFEKKLVSNKTDLKNINNSKSEKNNKLSKYAGKNKQNSKPKKSKFFGFFTKI